jgi:hypothetical protein
MILQSVLGFIICSSKHRLIILLSSLCRTVGLLFTAMINLEVASFANFTRVHLSVLVFAVGWLLDATKPVVAVCTETFWVIRLVDMITTGYFFDIFSASSLPGWVFKVLPRHFWGQLLRDVVFFFQFNWCVVFQVKWVVENFLVLNVLYFLLRLGHSKVLSLSLYSNFFNVV